MNQPTQPTRPRPPVDGPKSGDFPMTPMTLAPPGGEFRPVLPAMPNLPPFPDVRPRDQFSNDTYFRTAVELDPVPVIPPVPRPGPERTRGLAYDTPPAPPVYRQPANVATAVRREFVYRPGPVRTDITQAMLGLDDDDSAKGSGGAAIQLLAVGPQNYALDINPQMSFFKASYRRHAPIALECYDQEVTLAWGSTTSIPIQRRGDMLGDVILELRLPNLGIAGGTWADAIGYVLMTRARLVMDDVVIHDHERLWYDLVDRVYMPHGRRAAIDAMIGRGRTLSTNSAHTVHLPFKFFCGKNHYTSQQLFPLVCLAARCTLTLEFTAETLEACVNLPTGAALPATPPVLRATLLTEQMHMEPDEQRIVARRGALLAIDSFQDVDAVSYLFDDSGTTDIPTVRLDMREVNLPVRALLFVAYDENAVTNKKYFEYADCVDAAQLLFGSSERFSERQGDYFSLVQTYQHSAGCTPDRVHMYSFALDASARQPCGALNFAAVDAPTLHIRLKNSDGRPIKVKAFAHCTNWLTTTRGSMSFVFSV